MLFEVVVDSLGLIELVVVDGTSSSSVLRGLLVGDGSG